MALHLGGLWSELPSGCSLLEPGDRGSLNILEDKKGKEDKVTEGELAFCMGAAAKVGDRSWFPMPCLGAISEVPSLGWAQILSTMTFCEIGGDYDLDMHNGKPGDFGCEVLTSSDPESLTKKMEAEIVSLRRAMMAFIGMFVQHGLTGPAWGDWSNYTDSPLRAFESERDVQPPVGFWDPLGLAADGDVATFRRRRAVELKHGRICMLACIGYTVPESYKVPGFVSPSLGLKFSCGFGRLRCAKWLWRTLQRSLLRAAIPALSDEDKEKKLSAELQLVAAT